MDMDATIRSYSLDEGHIGTAIDAVCVAAVDDGISFKRAGISPIRDDEYGGFQVSLVAVYGNINAPLSVDIASGDVITPCPVKRKFTPLFNETEPFELWTYNTETILAEKVETVLRRGEFNTRLRDFYDIHLIVRHEAFNFRDFRAALAATSAHRGTAEQIKPSQAILKVISESPDLKRQWERYRKEYAYAKGIDFEDTINAIKELLA